MNYLGKRERAAERRGAAKALGVMFLIIAVAILSFIYSFDGRIKSIIREANATAVADAEKRYSAELKRCKGFVKLVSGSEYDDAVKMNEDIDRIYGKDDGE